jgi:hypothetical protein
MLCDYSLEIASMVNFHLLKEALLQTENMAVQTLESIIATNFKQYLCAKSDQRFSLRIYHSPRRKKKE